MNEDVELMKSQFNIKLAELIRTKSDNNCYMSKTKYDEKITTMKEIKSKATGKTPSDYQRLKRFDIMNIGDDEKLVFPTPVCYANNIIFRHYVCNEELFDILHETHLIIGHAGRNRMKLELEKTYKNITIQAIMIYLGLCKTCQKKLKLHKNTHTHTNTNTNTYLNTNSNSCKPPETVQAIPTNTNISMPTTPTNTNISLPTIPTIPTTTTSTNNYELTRCQVDLIDMQNETDNGFKFILVYQELATKYIQLRPLKNRQPEDIAHLLLDIFSIFGAPCILQSTHGLEFSNKIVEQINKMWKDCRIASGAAQQYVDVQQNIIQLQAITKMLNVWLKTNKTVNWSEGLRFVQLSKNRAYHVALQMSPHEAVFGAPIRIGLQSSSTDFLGAQRENDLQQLKNDCANIADANQINSEITIKTEDAEINDNMEMWDVSEY